MKINEIPRKERDNITGDRKRNLIEGGKIWIEFWRKNIEIFVEQYFGIKLHLFQKIPHRRVRIIKFLQASIQM